MVSSIGITDGTHCNDNLLSVLSSVVVEQLVISTDLSVYLVHVLLYDSRHSVIVRVALLLLPGRRYPGSEQNLSDTDGSDSDTDLSDAWIASNICHFFQIFVIPCLNLLDLMRSTETVEEVDERKTCP